jgi:hypothetical protein
LSKATSGKGFLCAEPLTTEYCDRELTTRVELAKYLRAKKPAKDYISAEKATDSIKVRP